MDRSKYRDGQGDDDDEVPEGMTKEEYEEQKKMLSFYKEKMTKKSKKLTIPKKDDFIKDNENEGIKDSAPIDLLNMMDAPV